MASLQQFLLDVIDSRQKMVDVVLEWDIVQDRAVMPIHSSAHKPTRREEAIKSTACIEVESLAVSGSLARSITENDGRRKICRWDSSGSSPETSERKASLAPSTSPLHQFISGNSICSRQEMIGLGWEREHVHDRVIMPAHSLVDKMARRTEAIKNIDHMVTAPLFDSESLRGSITEYRRRRKQRVMLCRWDSSGSSPKTEFEAISAPPIAPLRRQSKDESESLTGPPLSLTKRKERESKSSKRRAVNFFSTIIQSSLKGSRMKTKKTSTLGSKDRNRGFASDSDSDTELDPNFQLEKNVNSIIAAVMTVQQELSSLDLSEELC